MGDLLHPIQIRLARRTFLQVVIILALQAILLTLRHRSHDEIATACVLFFLALASWLGTGLRSYQRSRSLSLLMAAALLLAPWTSGGIRHPAAFLSLVLLHPMAFFFGTRIAWGYAGILIGDVILLCVGESRGWITGSAPDSETLLLVETTLICYTIFFTAPPLAQIRRLLAAGDRHLEARATVEHQLASLETQLEMRVEERKQELLERRDSLQVAARKNAVHLQPGIERLRAAIESLRKAYPENDARKALRRIAESGTRIESMQAGLERFCHLAGQAPHIRHISPQEHSRLACEVWEEIQHASPSSALLDAQPLPECEADPVLLRHVWQNLLSNAAKYSSKAHAPKVAIWHDAQGIHVQDNGVGFDEGQTQPLFGLFQRLHSASDFPGTGVGLAITHRILEMHQGTLSATAKPEKGATFTFTLPSLGIASMPRS